VVRGGFEDVITIPFHPFLNQGAFDVVGTSEKSSSKCHFFLNKENRKSMPSCYLSENLREIKKKEL
jgi:hypothetical protein